MKARSASPTWKAKTTKNSPEILICGISIQEIFLAAATLTSIISQSTQFPEQRNLACVQYTKSGNKDS